MRLANLLMSSPWTLAYGIALASVLLAATALLARIYNRS